MKTELDNDGIFSILTSKGSGIPKHLSIKPGTPVISVYQATLIDAGYYDNKIPEHLTKHLPKTK